MTMPRAGAVLLAAIAFAAVGCGRGDPLARTVSAADGPAVARWELRLATDCSPADRRRIEQALQDIRLKIMGDKEARGSAGIADALSRKVHGRSVREVLQLGCESRLLRLRAEGAELERALEQNSRLMTRPGDTASERHLVEIHGKQWNRLEKYRADIAAAEGELRELIKVTGRLLIEPPVDNPEVMPQRVKTKV